MPQTLHAHFLPSLVAPENLAGADVVVIDILRASTTITFALANGAECVLPCLEIEEAQALANDYSPDKRILGGEREGLPIAGFDCGNSPSEYSPVRVAGKTVIFTTTNGTRAMDRCRQAGNVWIGSFVTISTVLKQLENAPAIHLMCAGTGGGITREDVLFAGAVVYELSGGYGKRKVDIELNDQARLAGDAWRASFSGDVPLTDFGLEQQLLQTQGGRNLQRIGLAADVADVARLDLFDFVPWLDLSAWRITRA